MKRFVFMTIAALAMVIAMMAATTLAFGTIPKAVIAAIAQQHNEATFKSFQPILNNAFAGFYPEEDYTMPLLPIKMPQHIPFLVEMLGLTPTPFNVAKDPSKIKVVPLTDTDGAKLVSHASYGLQNETAVVWSKASNLVGLFHLVPFISNPTKCVNFYSDVYPTGDESGKLFEIDYKSPNGVQYDSLSHGIDELFGLLSPSSNLLYSLDTVNKTTAKAIKKEAAILRQLFPIDTFEPREYTVPKTTSKGTLTTLFRSWTKESFQISTQIYNTFLNYPKAQRAAHLDSDLGVSGATVGQEEWNPLENRLFADKDANDKALPVTTEQLRFFRYLLTKQMALAGYRIASILAASDPSLHVGQEKEYPLSFISPLYRAFAIVALVALAIFAYLTVSTLIKSAAKEKQSAEQSLLENSLNTP